MNVLYLSYDGLTDPLGQSQIMPYLISCSSEELRFTVLSFEKRKTYREEHKNVLPKLNHAGIKWIAKKYNKWPPLLSSIIDLVKMIRVSKKILNETPFEVIHCRSYVPAFAAFYLKKRLGVKVLFDMRGFWADERMEGHIWSNKNLLHRIIYKNVKKSESNWWKNADHIVSLTEKAKAFITQNSVIEIEKKISVIPCCADEVLFTPEIDGAEIKELKSNLSINENEKVLIYVGSLGTWYLGREMMWQFADLYNRKLIDRFLWITKDSEEKIKRIATEMALPSASVIVRSATRKEVPTYLSIADLGIFYIRPSFSKSASSPTKLGEMLLIGLPVITNTGVGDLDLFFSENDIGYIHDLSNPASKVIDDQIIKNLFAKSKNEIREVGLRYLSLKAGSQKYLSVYRNLGLQQK